MLRFAALATSLLLLPSCFDLEQDPADGPRPQIISLVTSTPTNEPFVLLEPPIVSTTDAGVDAASDAGPDSGSVRSDESQRSTAPCCDFTIEFTYRLAPDQFVRKARVTFDALRTPEEFNLPFVPDDQRTPEMSGKVHTRVPPQIADIGTFGFQVRLVTGRGVVSPAATGSIDVR